MHAQTLTLTTPPQPLEKLSVTVAECLVVISSICLWERCVLPVGGDFFSGEHSVSSVSNWQKYVKMRQNSCR